MINIVELVKSKVDKTLIEILDLFSIEDLDELTLREIETTPNTFQRKFNVINYALAKRRSDKNGN